MDSMAAAGVLGGFKNVGPGRADHDGADAIAVLHELSQLPQTHVPPSPARNALQRRRMIVNII